MSVNLHEAIRQLQDLSELPHPGHEPSQQAGEILDRFAEANRNQDAYVDEKIEEVRTLFATSAGAPQLRESIYKLSRLVSADGNGIASPDSWSLRNFF